MEPAALDVADVLDDPDFVTRGVPLTSYTLSRGANGHPTATPKVGTVDAVIVPAVGKELAQQLEGAALRGSITLYTRAPLTAGDATHGADVVEWEGAPYRVTIVRAWRFGPVFYEVVATLATLNPSPLDRAEAVDALNP